MRNLILILLTALSINVFGQEYDMNAAKAIKTEINLNRIYKSMSPAYRLSSEQEKADSLNWLYFIKYKESIVENAKGIEKNFAKMHVSLELEMDKDSHVAYNFFVIHDIANYKKELRDMMSDHDAYFYHLTATDISVSVILYDNKYIVTIIS